MLESHSQSASVGFESEIETGPATPSITILGLRFNVQSPYSAGHVCTKGEARALNQKRLEGIRNHLAVMAKSGALTQVDVDAYAASYVFGERTTRLRPVEAEALALARVSFGKRGNLERRIPRPRGNCSKAKRGKQSESKLQSKSRS